MESLNIGMHLAVIFECMLIELRIYIADALIRVTENLSLRLNLRYVKLAHRIKNPTLLIMHRYI
jgi:hypothetical protein